MTNKAILQQTSFRLKIILSDFVLISSIVIFAFMLGKLLHLDWIGLKEEHIQTLKRLHFWYVATLFILFPLLLIVEIVVDEYRRGFRENIAKKNI